MTDAKLIIQNAERTIAVLIAEAAAADERFQASLLDRLCGDLGLAFAVTEPRVQARPDVFSAKDGHDFTIHATAAGTRVIFLLSVGAQRDLAAAARARDSATALRAENPAALVFTVRVSAEIEPQDAAESGFDAVAPLNEVRDAFVASLPAMQGRCLFQRRLFENCERSIREILKSGDGGQSFRSAYLAFIEQTEASLPVSSAISAGEGASADKVVFDADTLPLWTFLQRPRLAHHPVLGLVSLRVEKWGEHVEALAAMMEPALAGTGFTLATTGGAPGEPDALLILSEAPQLDPSKPFEKQRAEAWECVQSALRLKKWWLGRRTAARYWAEHVNPDAPGEAAGRVRRDVPI